MIKLLHLCIFVFLSVIVAGQTISPSGSTTICPGGTRVLTVTAPVGTTYQWLQGVAPGITPILNATSNTYVATTPGTYSVKIGGAVPNDTLGPVTVTLATLPVAGFTFLPNTTMCGNTPITFTSTSGAGLTCTWQFDDPNSGGNNVVTSSTVSAIHNFIGNPGNATQDFQVKLVVQNSAGCKDSIIRQVTINQIPGPALNGDGQINFQGQIYFKHCSTSPSLFTFTNQTLPVINSNYQIIWGDGTPSFDMPAFPATLTHTYNVGNYILRFIVTGINGCVDTTSYGVFVGDAPNGGIGTENPVLSGCTGTTFNFPFLPGVFTNPVGTFYYLSVDDGSADTVFSQPPPPDYSHTFYKPSCGVGASNSNYFTVSLIITNPCNISGIPGSIGGIKISQTPVADFTVSKDTLCINQVATLTDQSFNNYINESGECSPGKSLWSITPGVQGTDWVVTSGITGSDNNSSSPSDWTAGSSTLQVQFLKPNIYVVKIKTGGSDQCGIDSAVKSICVNPLPKVNFSLTSDTLCSALKDSVIYTPAIASCGNNIYEWSVSYIPAAGCFPDTANYQYVDGTNAGSANPHLTFISPGTYQIRLIAYSPGRACSDQSEKDVVVKGIPGVSLPANAGICQNQPVGFTGTVSCFITNAIYTWSFPGSSNPTSNLPNPLPVTYSNGGNYDVSLTVSNECGVTNSVEHIVVDTLVPANAGPDTTLCGSSITMGGNSPGIASGVWSVISGPNTPSITLPSSPTTTIIGLVPGTYIFKWKIGNGGCADSSTVSVVIVPGPTQANAGPDQQLCLATSTTFAANTPLTGTGKWSFISGPNTPVITTVSSPTSAVNGLVPGTYVFTWTTSFSNCVPSIDTMQVINYDNPTVANAGTDQTICTSTVMLAGNAAAIGTGEWSLFNGPNIPFITSPALASTTVTGLVSGVYSFVWRITNGTCISSADTVQITVSTIANNVVNGNQSICINTVPAAINGSTPVGGNGSYNYQWQQSADAGLIWNDIIAATNVNYIPGVLTQTTCYRRIVTTTLCPLGDPSAPVCVTVNPDAHALFAAANTTLCAPVNIESLITVTPFPDRNLQYYWYANNIPIGITNGLPPSFTINAPGQTVVIKLVTTSLFGCKPDSMSITFVTLPSVTANFTKGVISGCGPLSVNFVNTSSILNNSVQFFWDFGNGTTLSNIVQPTSPVVYNASPLFRDTTYYITLKAFSGCDTSFKRDSIMVFANPKARFTSIATGCSPFRDTIINNSFGQDGFTTYYWDFGDNSTDTTFTTGKVYHMYNTGIVDTFTIRLIAENRCGRDTQYMDVVVTPNIIQPQISINGSELYGCAPHTVNFQNSSLGASLLDWDFGDGTSVEIVPNSQSVISHTYLKSGDYTVHIKLENDCTDTTILKEVIVYDPPLASFNLVKTLLCEGDAVFTSNTSANANSYEWLWGDSTSSSASNASHIYINPGTYFIRLVAKKINAFGTVCTDTSAPAQVTIVARIPAVVNINPGNNPCTPYAINVFADGAANAGQVDWYFYDSNVSPGIFHVAGPTASYTYNNDGVDSVKLIVTNTAGCSDSTIKQFTVHKTPVVSFTPLNVKTCNTDTTITFNVTVSYTGTDPVSYEWYINDQLSGNSNPFSYQFQAPPGITATDPFTIKVLVKNSFGCGDTTLVGNFVIQTLARQHIVVSPSIVQEQPNYTFMFSDSAQGLPNTTYLWVTGDRNGTQLPGKEITYKYGDTGTFHVQLFVKDFETGCEETDSITVYVLAVPGYLYVPNAFCPGCQKAELRQFLPLGKGLHDYHLIIFNIWGRKVFETTSLDVNGVPNEPWDGNWQAPGGQNVQQGAFSWHIDAHYINGTEWKGMINPKTNQLEKQGFISIIR